MKNVSRRSNGHPSVPTLEQIDDFETSDYWIDIEKYVKRLIWPTENQGLKIIGKIAGAHWAEGANGALSTVWFDTWARSTDATERESLKNQLLDYNRNDVEATLIIRNWVNDGLTSDPPRIMSISALDGKIF